MKKDLSHENFYVLLAKEAVENYIKKRKIISTPPNLPKELLKRKAGAFVTIKKQGKLRGCIGTYLPTEENIAKEIIKNSISAAAEDPRFPPITPNELPYLSYIVYVLEKPEPVKNIDELNPKKYGIIVKTETKSALLLPDLEGIETKEQQIIACCQKAGINPTKEKIAIYKFTAEKYE